MDIDKKIDEVLSRRDIKPSERTPNKPWRTRKVFAVGVALLLLSGVVLGGSILLFFARTPISVTVPSLIYFDGQPAEELVTSTFTINNAVANNSYSMAHNLSLSPYAENNYIVAFNITEPPELSIYVLTVQNDTSSSITSLELTPGGNSTIYYHIHVNPMASAGTYTGNITIE